VRQGACGAFGNFEKNALLEPFYSVDAFES